MGVHVSFELGGKLAEHVATVTGENGAYVSVEAYVCDLIRRDVAAVGEAEEPLPAAVKAAFATPRSACVRLTADAVIQRGRARRAA